MEEAPKYQEIFQKGVKIGKLEIIFRQINRRFGVIPPELESRIKELSNQQLDALVDVFLALQYLVCQTIS
jgi:tRNA nucleotidyltransferase/poly(A) polymerase